MSQPCVVCATPTHPVSDWLRVCPDCGQWGSELSPRFDDADRQDALDRQGLSAASTALRRRNLATILDAAGPAARMLDVGAGDGMAMDLAANAGVTCVGIEPDPGLAAACADRGLTVHAGLFPDDLPDVPPFDVILFNHVLEHLQDPGAALVAARALLAPGGRVVVHSPSAAGTLVGLAGALRRLGFVGPLERMWWRRFPSPLLHRFTPRSLTRLAEGCGLQRIHLGRTDPLQIRGLWGRLGAARGLSPVAHGVLWAGLATLAPLLRALPGDYFFVILRARDPSR